MTRQRPGRLRRLVSSLMQTKADQHAAALQSSVRTVGATPIARCAPGEPATMSGVLSAVTLRPRENVPAVEADLFDGSGHILLVWLGRRRIRGIEPGRSIVVTGRITHSADQPAVFNPSYELRPAGRGTA